VRARAQCGVCRVLGECGVCVACAPCVCAVCVCLVWCVRCACPLRILCVFFACGVHRAAVLRCCAVWGQNHRAAFELYQRAGELGSLAAWRNVAAMYAAGEGVPQCQQTARSILQFVASKEGAGLEGQPVTGRDSQ
jgi:hypothetical protein